MTPRTLSQGRRWWRGRRLVTILGFLLACSCNPAATGEIKPADVHQVVETINAQLGVLLGVTNIVAHRGQATPPLTPRQPHHVVQKAREVMLKVQTLRTLNGLPENPVPPFPVEEATPSDSKRMVDVISQDIAELRTKLNITEPVPPAPAVPDKTPTDVYDSLQRVSDTLDLLGVPRTVPNDVFRVAVMIVKELEAILAARGHRYPAVAVTPSTDMSPEDSYGKTFEVLNHLKTRIEADPALMVRGGIVLPNRRPPPLTPAHALDLENNLLAELGAVKATLGIRTPTVVPPLVHGKTPADTVDLLNRALMLVDAL
ncbi:MAG: hypothetical protein WCO00_11910 [Rhodospirillaceae bacterium]